MAVNVVPVGHVSLVGAGPGDPGLLTRTAIARLRAADVVFYDALIDDRILRYARRAQRFFVGKRAGRHAMSQRTIEALLVRAARRGKRVVRLKGGDPFVFGRGGEEALALQRAGIAFDVVPGITSAVAAPAAAGIPVTHRGVASAFLVVSGHEEESFASAIRQMEPHGATVVILMGLGRSAALLAPADGARLVGQHAGRRHPRRDTAGSAGVAGHAGASRIRRARAQRHWGRHDRRRRRREGVHDRQRRTREPERRASRRHEGKDERAMTAETQSTFGRTRLSFAKEADIVEFVATLERFERGEITPDQWRSSVWFAAPTASARPTTRRCCG